MAISDTQNTGTRHAGPNPGTLAIVFTVLFFAGLLSMTLFTGGAYPTPFKSSEEIAAFFRSYPFQVSLGAFFQFGSAIPLGLYTATMTSRLRFHGVRSAGVDIALFGGFSASLLTLVWTLIQWTLAQPAVTSDGTLVRALFSLIFALGGPGYSVPLGLLIAGISVPAYFFRLLPRWVCYFGFVLAAIGELSSLGLVFPQVFFLIPLTRFPGFLWLIAAGYTLPSRTRASSN
ncbi:MAG: hypothetical protein JWM56_572 [Candidatus Peribacteria bacterium]|nr:hypothetical protein [Candidatus Peribacteria bacterium]